MPQANLIDLSHWDTMQTDGFGKLARAGYRGVINKATEGAGLVDVTYKLRQRDALDAGLNYGAYHFATREDPIAQADHFLNIAQPDDSTLLALDWEENDKRPTGTMTVEQAKTWLNRVMEKTGRSPKGVWIYGGNVLKEQIVSKADCDFFGQFPLWLCQYAAKPKLPKAWSKYTAWQFTETGHADGVTHSGGCDNNVVCAGFDFDRDWGANKPASPAPMTIADLVPVSRKAALTVASKRVLQGTTGASLLSALGMSQDTYNQVSAIVANHWLAIAVTAGILGIIVFKVFESYMVDDVNSGRATPSGAANG